MQPDVTLLELRDLDRAKRQSARRGWSVVVAAFAVLFALFGTTYSFSAFFLRFRIFSQHRKVLFHKYFQLSFSFIIYRARLAVR
jgi:hypothetical protein